MELQHLFTVLCLNEYSKRKEPDQEMDGQGAVVSESDGTVEEEGLELFSQTMNKHH